ncbi:RNA polymerase sigma factor [Streptomyces sp. NPDC050988]|uniref:RNA polymerase sigma factor n=1 Tax=Streptomyces sp. NPDC050988 TaxID=3365637 RepID=UPI0037A5015E
MTEHPTDPSRSDPLRTLADFDGVYLTKFPGVVRALVLLGADRSTAEDLAQESFLIALHHWDTVGRYDKPGAWVARTAVNKWRQFGRTARRRHDVLSSIASADHVGEQRGFEGSDRHIDVLQALAKLTGRQREVLALYYLLDHTVSEVAATLNIAEGTVKSTLHDARSALAKWLAPGYADDPREGGARSAG